MRRTKQQNQKRDMRFSFVLGLSLGFITGIILGYHLFNDAVLEQIKYVVG